MKKKTINVVLLTTATVASIIFIFYSLSVIAEDSKTETYAGTIKKIASFERHSKHSSYDDRCILVNFDKYGDVSIYVSEDSIMRYDVGDRVYYNLTKYEITNTQQPTSHFIITVLFILLCFFIVAIGIYYFVEFCTFLYSRLED